MLTAFRVCVSRVYLRLVDPELPGEHGSLAPANDLQRRKAILMNHAEVAIRLAEYFFSWMRLEAK